MPDPKLDRRRDIVLSTVNEALADQDVQITEWAADRVLDALDAHDATRGKP